MPPSVDLPSSVPASMRPENGNITSESSTQVQQKRNRIQLSCSHCRHAKSKCDREQPCSQCIKKGRASLCTFPAPTKRKRPAVSMQNRLKHLESLVKGVMTGQAADGDSDISLQPTRSLEVAVASQHQKTAEATVAANLDVDLISKIGSHSNSLGQVVIGPNESTYVGATHWAAILDDIEEVKSYFNDPDVDGSPGDESVRPDTSLIFNSQTTATKEDLLAALPERAVVDRLVYRYFNSHSPALYIIHKPTFQKEYRKFWADQRSTPISWVALLYSLMCLATFSGYGAGEDILDNRGTAIEMIRAYRGCCAQCLVLSNYAQPGPYTLETLLIYMEGEFVLNKDDQMNCYLLGGVAVRLALRMGLHRDSENVAGNISVFQGEMRRRVWHLLVQIDLLVSFHIGLPSMVQSVESDTRLPSNLRDQDFDEDAITLPVPRPEVEMTPMSYAISKSRLCQSFGKVNEQANRLSLPKYEEVMSLDKLLNQAFAKVPPFFRMIPMDQAITDSPQDIIARFSLTLLFHKTRCVLHRKYVTMEKGNDEYLYSKRTALNASMELLFIQSDIHNAVQPGAPLSKDLWFVSSLSMHDFLLAAMITYVSLIQAIERPGLVTLSKHQEDVVKALERSFQVWNETRSMSVDTRKAREVLHSMVKRVHCALRKGNDHGAEPFSISQASTTEYAMEYNGSNLISGLSLNDPTASNGTISYSVPSNGIGQTGSFDSIMTSSGPGLQSDLDSMPIPIDSLGAMLDMPETLDWNVFDNHLRPQQATEETWPELSFENFGFGSNYDYRL